MTRSRSRTPCAAAAALSAALALALVAPLPAAAASPAPDRCSAVAQVGPWSIRVVEGAAGGSILLARNEAGAAVEFRRDAEGGLGESLILLATGDRALAPGEAGYRLVVDIDGAPIVAKGAMPRGARVYPALIAMAPADGMRLLKGFRAGARMTFTAQTTDAAGAVKAVVARKALDLTGSAAALKAGQARSRALAAGRDAGHCPQAPGEKRAEARAGASSPLVRDREFARP